MALVDNLSVGAVFFQIYGGESGVAGKITLAHEKTGGSNGWGRPTTKTAQAGAAAEAAQYATGQLDHDDGSQSNDFAIVFPIVTALYSKIHPEYVSYIFLLASISLAFLNLIGYVLCEISIIKANAAAGNEPVESANGRCPSIPPCSQMADSAYSTLKLMKEKVIVVVKIIESVFFNPELLITVLGVIGG
ncbi:hypothetical protein quinque_008767 [Culex quinquefasciatus]